MSTADSTDRRVQKEEQDNLGLKSDTPTHCPKKRSKKWRNASPQPQIHSQTFGTTAEVQLETVKLDKSDGNVI